MMRKSSVKVVVTIVSIVAIFLITAGFRYNEAKARLDSVVGTSNHVTVEKMESELLDTGRIVEDDVIYPEVSADEDYVPAPKGEIGEGPDKEIVNME